VSNAKIIGYTDESPPRPIPDQTEINRADRHLRQEISDDFSYFQELDFDKNPLVIPNHTTISTVAKKMIDTNKSYAIVTNNARIIGLITDADFRKKIAFGNINLDADCTTLMQQNVSIVEETISVAEAQLLLLKNETNRFISIGFLKKIKINMRKKILRKCFPYICNYFLSRIETVSHYNTLNSMNLVLPHRFSPKKYAFYF
jgi:hypothetical protein